MMSKWTREDSLLSRAAWATLIDHGLSPGDILHIEQKALLVEIERLEAIQKTKEAWAAVAGTVTAPDEEQ